MKIRTLISVTLLFSVTFFAEARYITENEALSKAKSFMTESRIKSSQKGYMKLAHKEQKSDKVNYYVFGKGENSGFVIVSGSDRTDGILGYVDNGNFDCNNLPDNMKYWLDEYARQIEYSENNNLRTGENPRKTGKSVAPLLGNINWNQNSPFNDRCPVLEDGNHAASGCVATAFAQVMYYYKWPEKGIGSHSYISGKYKFELSADFGATTYRWNEMTPFYNSGSSAESRDAVAELLFHVGVSCDMNYSRSSGAISADAARAMAEYFNYDKRLSCINRDYYSRDEWTEIIKNELDNKRPVPYSGSSELGGHQFVFDGYDENDMFHVNWGWGGDYNGYFKISVLTPEGQGIGGYDGGYNLHQSAIVGMMKPDSTVDIPRFCPFNGEEVVVNKATVQQGEKIEFRVKSLYNHDFRQFKGAFNVGLCNGNGEMVAFGIDTMNVTVDFNNGWNEFDWQNSFTGVPDDTYKLCPLYRYDDSSAWEKIRFKAVGNSVKVTVSGNSMKVENVSANLNFDVTDIVIGESFEGMPTLVKYNITNYGDEYDRPLYVAVYNKDDLFTPVYKGPGIVTPILNGETIPVTTMENFKLPVGDYSLTVIDEYGLEFGDYVDFSVLKPTPFDLTLTDVEAESEYGRENFNFKLTFTNTGGPYHGSIYVFIYKGKTPPSEFGNSEDVLLKNNVLLPGDSTSTVIEFNESLYIEEGEYYALPGYLDGETIYMMDKGFAFSLKEESGVESVEVDKSKMQICPNPVEDVLNLNVTGNLEKVSVFNMNGALVKQANEATIDVSELASGNYIVVAEIDGKPSAKTFIKK